MDIALLSKMVKTLLSRNDSVTLPGFGRFELEDVPASFSDKGFTINPPYKKVVFTPAVGEDNLLCESYAKANAVSVSRAKDLIMECVYGIVSDLKNSKQVEFPDFGRLKMTRGGTVLFVATPDLVLRPQFDMLAPISLKSLDLAAASEPVVSEPVVAAQVVSEAVNPEPVATAQAASETTVPESEAEAEPVHESVAEPAVESAPESIEEPAIESVSELAVEPIDEPLVEPAHEAVAEPVADPVIEPADEPIVESVVEPVVEPVVESDIEPVIEPVAEDAAKAEPAATPDTPVATPNSTPAPARNRAARAILITLLVVVLLAALALGVLAILGRTAPDFVDQFLYTPEELRIIRTVI